MTLQQYITTLDQRYKLGNATEHTFRGDLARLIETIVPDVIATNEPKRQSCGAPDYILTKKDVPVGFIEAKDIGDKDLEGLKKSGNKEQFDRYKSSLDNLIFTDYLDFHLYRNGEFITKIAVGEVVNGEIKPVSENFIVFENLIKDFTLHIGQTIKSPKKLAEMMAGKARLLSDVIEKALTSDEDNYENSTLREQKEAFKNLLIHDITPKGFADVYAQTIAYGMFAARLHDPTLPTFSRQEAAELIPKTNPFLRRLFGYIAGPDLDNRIKWIVDDLVNIFLACNVAEILKDYGKTTKMEDPIIHFYETFLSEYDPKLRKARGVWYTPQPVVNFIVRAVDDILKTEFNLPQGLADTSKTKIKIQAQETDKRFKDNIKTFEQEVHKVQILDPAAGTGTFLAEVVKHVHKKFAGQQGIWSNYVEQHLLPRLNGFELLMASYAMAHLQLDLLLTDTGFKATKDQRLRVYLTNSLEKSHPDTGTLFANWLSNEANEANRIKRDTPVMCVIGNPPYSVSSTNKGEWIQDLILDYKKDLNERNIQPLSDDYIKFIRYGQYFIGKTGEGILAYISNNSFIDGIIHRRMREELMKTFDKIYILDLHGNSKKKEIAPDGSIDQNVFDIMQGVSINFFVKTGKKKTDELGKVFHYDLYGKRDMKYDFLSESSIQKIPFTELPNIAPNYFFVNKDNSNLDEWEKGFKIDDFFPINTSGITTGNDKELVSEVPFLENNDRYSYKPFDNRFINYDREQIQRARFSVMKHFIGKNKNVGLCLMKTMVNTTDFKTVFITSFMMDKNYYGFQSYIFPLYAYQENFGREEKIPNLNAKIISEIEKGLDLRLVPEKENGNLCFSQNNNELQNEYKQSFAPIDVLDYIYAVLHSPSYREKYKEFLKIDFPRVPYPTNKDTFWKLVDLGSQIRQIHLLESPVTEQYITQYPEDGDNVVGKPRFVIANEVKQSNEKTASFLAVTGRVYINDTQYFDNVPETAWNFYIGGYQPAQKWLKDRKDRTLDFEDILHYQKIIVALSETDRLMKEIDKIELE